jgi:hypothetical protein
MRGNQVAIRLTDQELAALDRLVRRERRKGHACDRSSLVRLWLTRETKKGKKGK